MKYLSTRQTKKDKPEYPGDKKDEPGQMGKKKMPFGKSKFSFLAARGK